MLKLNLDEEILIPMFVILLIAIGGVVYFVFRKRGEAEIAARAAQQAAQASLQKSAHALEAATKGLKVVQNLTSSVDGLNVDNLVDRIHAHNVTAQAEFDRTASGFTPAVAPPDPLKTAAVDDLLNSL